MENNPKKTIIYVGGFELPDKNAAAHRVINNGKIFRALGYNVVFLGISHTYKKLQCDEFYGFQCWSMPYPKSKKEWIRYISDFSMLKKIIEQEEPEGIVFYNYQAISFLKSLMYCKKRKIWTISDVTEWYLAEGNILFRIIKQLDTSVRMRILNKRADGIIAISSFLEKYYQNCGCNVVKIPPLIDKSDKKWCTTVERHHADDRIRLIYAGSTTDLKDNLSIVYNAVKRFPNAFLLTIVGMEDEKVNGLIGNQGAERSFVQVCGRLPHQECLDLIKQSDFQIFIRPNNLVTKAGFPTKLGESFACGTPVITNASSNISDYLVDGKNGFLVEEVSEGSLAITLKKVLDVKASIEEMKGYCASVDAFEYKRYTEEIKAALQTIKGEEVVRNAEK